MVVTANDLKDAGVEVPLLVGGAALSEKYTNGEDRADIHRAYFLREGRDDGTAHYERDHGSGGAGEKLAAAHLFGLAKLPERDMGEKVNAGTTRSAKVRVDLPILSVPYLDRRLRDIPQLPEIWGYINPFMLYGRHMGFKGNFEKQLLQRDEKALALFHQMEEVKEEAVQWMKARAVWQFFEAERDGNSIRLFEAGALQSSPHLPFRSPASKRWPVPERLHFGTGKTVNATTLRCSW